MIDFMIVILIISWAIFILGFLVEENTILMISSLFLISIGVFIIANGIDGVNNYATQLFGGIIHIAIGGYVLMRTGIAEIEKSKL
jgi:hypothetical protein